MSNIPVPAPILINSQAEKIGCFLKANGTIISHDHCFNVFLNLDLKEDEKNSLPKIIEALNNHFTPQKNVIYERYIFNTSNQEENEGIDSYTNRLRGLASSCEYDILTEELIRDRIVLGIKDNRVRKKLLMEPKLNLSSAIDICRTAEVTEQQITKLTGQESEDVKWNKKYERKKEATKATNETFEDIINCRYCGSKHRKASWCNRKKSFLKTNQTVPLECQLDSGFTCNIMSLDDYRWGMQERSNNLDISNARLENIGYLHITTIGGVILKPVGQKYLDCYFKEKKYNLLFQIVNINQKPLLSTKTIEDLNLVTKHDSVYHLENSSCSRAESIINKYEDVFKGLGMLPKEYHIEIEKEATPVQRHPRRIPIGLKAEFKRKLDDLEERGIIERKQNKLRVCLDPRDLNKVIKRPHFQIPTIDEILPSLNNAKIFTVIDAKDGFWQVKLDNQISDLTTFWTPFGRYKWLRMPFGISAAPEEFQRRLHEVIEGLEGVEVIADDILVFGKGNTTEDAIRDHNIKLEQLLMRARERNLKFNKGKIRLCSNHVNYMGHILSDEGLKPDPGKVEAIKAISRPQNPTPFNKSALSTPPAELSAPFKQTPSTSSSPAAPASVANFPVRPYETPAPELPAPAPSTSQLPSRPEPSSTNTEPSAAPEEENQDMTDQTPFLISSIGPKYFGILRNLVFPEEVDQVPFDKLCKILLKHFNPKTNIIYERFIFQKMDQKSGETISKYIIRLKEQAQRCNFGDFLQESLRDRFVGGIIDTSTQKKLLQEEGLTFEGALDIALSAESADNDLHNIKRSENAHQSPQHLHAINNACKHCGYSGSKIPILGKAKFNIKLRNVSRIIEILITDLNCSKFLLGRDFLNLCNISFNYLHKLDSFNIDSLLNDYESIFEYKSGPIKGIKCHLDVKADFIPKFYKFRQVPFALKQLVENEIDKLVDLNILTPIDKSDCASPLVCVAKPNGQIRLCADFKKSLNHYLEDVKYPIPNIDSVLINFQGKKLFTKLDLSKGYHQIEMDDISKKYLVVSTHKGLYNYNRLAFGIKTASEIFQKTMESFFSGINDVYIYFDDILIASEDLESHLDILKRTLNILKENNFTINKNKCLFVKNEIEYLGHKINEF
ncbi:K02A2.6-like, partial [Cordylochernes scorpioides]